MTNLISQNESVLPTYQVIESGGSYVVIICWPANAPCDLAMGRIWDEERSQLSPPLLLGSIIAHMNTQSPWGPVAAADVPPSLRALIALIDAG